MRSVPDSQLDELYIYRIDLNSGCSEEHAFGLQSSWKDLTELGRTP